MSESRPASPRTDTLVIGATVRTIGAWPSAWRHEGAHRDPMADASALRAVAEVAEAAGLHFLYFGDWLASGSEFEHTDPYLVARVDPLSSISYLAAVTSRIGLIASVSSAHLDAYPVARNSASIDILSDGRAGLSISSGSEPRSAANFGWEHVHADDDRVASSAEFIAILRGLWDSWEHGAFVADVGTGQYIDASKLHHLNFEGRYRSSAGPLNVPRPPQGHPVISIVGNSIAAQALAAREADLTFVSVAGLADAVEKYAAAKARAREFGRSADEFVQVTPIMPIVAESREQAWAVYDELVSLVPLETASGISSVTNLPANRTIRSLAGLLGVSLNGVLMDEPVPAKVAAQFGRIGNELLTTVQSRSGRAVGGYRPITYRHLLVAHVVSAPIIVGSVEDVADFMESWFLSRATDGFTILSAFQDQLVAFSTMVIPELRRRGIFPRAYEGITLRDHLGLAVPVNSQAARRDRQ
ncbi:MAG: class flavin-dependent oxidoreductase [Microbacteriaceae bacterium]|nr:class flavin-dependent oxidoreductase [Microbacteriaceae bacterium]